MHSVVECGTCGTKSERREPYVDLQAAFEEKGSTTEQKNEVIIEEQKVGDIEMKKEYDLQSMIQDGLNDEVLEDENSFFC